MTSIADNLSGDKSVHKNEAWMCEHVKEHSSFSSPWIEKIAWIIDDAQALVAESVNFWSTSQVTSNVTCTQLEAGNI